MKITIYYSESTPELGRRLRAEAEYCGYTAKVVGSKTMTAAVVVSEIGTRHVGIATCSLADFTDGKFDDKFGIVLAVRKAVRAALRAEAAFMQQMMARHLARVKAADQAVERMRHSDDKAVGTP